MVMICPYCDSEINEKLLEQEEGCCPECGAPISANTVINEDEDEDDDFLDDDYEEDEFGSDLEDDEFGDMDEFGDLDDKDDYK